MTNIIVECVKSQTMIFNIQTEMTEMFPYSVPPGHLSVRKRVLVTAANESREPEPFFF